MNQALNIRKYRLFYNLLPQLSTQVNDKIHNFKKTDGLAFTEILRNGTGFNEESTITAGTMVDSYIEYLLKQWLQNGKKRGDT